MTLEEKLVLAGDILIFVGFGVTGVVYWLQGAATKRRDLEAALGLLRAVRNGVMQATTPAGIRLGRKLFNDAPTSRAETVG
jgi:hypothetical protein